MSLTEKLITNYEAHLEANWTREGERKPFEMSWEDVSVLTVSDNTYFGQLVKHPYSDDRISTSTLFSYIKTDAN